MTDRQRSHFGYDGWKALKSAENAVYSRGSKTLMPLQKKWRQKEKDVYALREKDVPRRKQSTRTSKTIVPRGSGRESIGRFR